MNPQLWTGTVRSKAAVAETSRERQATCYCVHFTADRRTHRMSVVDCVVDPEDLAGASAGPLAATLRVAGGGGLVGTIRHGDWLACHAVLLPGAPPAAESAAVERLRQLFRADCGQTDVSRQLGAYPLRPLLATFARRADLIPPLIDRAHRLLLAALLDRGGLLGGAGTAIEPRSDEAQEVWCR